MLRLDASTQNTISTHKTAKSKPQDRKNWTAKTELAKTGAKTGAQKPGKNQKTGTA